MNDSTFVVSAKAKFLLDRYIAKHNYTLIQTYETCGEEGGWHSRAKVKHNETGEIHYLYYDRSYKRTNKCQNCGHDRQAHSNYPEACSLCTCSNTRAYLKFQIVRGWRNVTLDNRRKKLRRATPKFYL